MIIRKRLIFIIIILFFVAILEWGLFFYFKNKSEAITHTITFVVNEEKGSVISKNVKNNDIVEAPKYNPQKDGYYFLGWFKSLDDEVSYDFSKPVVESFSLYPKYDKIINNLKHKITFDSNGGDTFGDLEVNEGELIELPTPSRDGYYFLGWYNGDNEFFSNSLVEEDIILTAHWQKENDNFKIYTVTFDSNGGSSISPKKVLENTAIYYPGTPIKEGYKFLGWYLKNNLYNFNDPVNKNITLKAVWQKENNVLDNERISENNSNNNNDNRGSGNNNGNNNSTLEYVTVVFNSNGGNIVSSVTTLKGSKITEPVNPTREGYKFLGWYNGDKKYDFNSSVSSNITLVAKWESLEVKPAVISYVKSSTGRFTYSNSPEELDETVFADSTLGNRLLYRDSFNGNNEIYYEHVVYNHNIYFAIRFYNPNPSNVTLKINKSGIMLNDGTWLTIWDNYYSGKNVTPEDTYIIGPYKTLYFYHTSNGFVNNHEEAEKIRGAFEGVLNVTSSNTLHFAILAFKTDYTKTLSATYTGIPELISYKEYGGYANYSPDLYNNATFEINDSVSKGTNMKVQYNGTTRDYWLTNNAGAVLAYYPEKSQKYSLVNVNDAYKYDMINITCQTDTGHVFTVGEYPNYRDKRPGVVSTYGIERPYNIANWAVHYHENITIKNTGSKTRSLSFYVNNNSVSKSIAAIVGSSNASFITKSNVFKKYSQANESSLVWKVRVRPGETAYIPTDVILAGMSSHSIKKYIYVDE